MVDVESEANEVSPVSPVSPVSDNESEISSIDLLMESYVNLEKKVEIVAKAVLKQTELLKEIREMLEER